MSDYPKVIDVGIKVTVQNAEEEAHWRTAHAPLLAADAPVPDPVSKPNPLDDVSVEMDNPAFAEQPKPDEAYDLATDTKAPRKKK